MRTKIPRCALALLGLALAGSVQAQWKWLDAAGQVNYSDHPPPVSVPATRILSQGGTLRAASAAPAAAAATSAGASLAATAGSGAAGGAAQDAAAAPDGRATASPAAAGSPSGSPAGSPVQQAASAAAGASPASGAPGKAEGAAPARPRTAAERLNELRKQQALKEAAEREADQLKRAQAGVAQWCEDLRGRARMLESGMRVARVDASGERSFVSDDERAAQLEAIRRDLDAQCAPGG